MRASAKQPMSPSDIKTGEKSAGPVHVRHATQLLRLTFTSPPLYFFLACDLKDRPRRIAFFLMNAGDRPVSSTTSSSDFEVRPSSISRRSSLNDQCLFRIITKTLVRTKPSSGVCLLDDFAVAGPDLEIIRSRIDIRSNKSRNKCRALS